MGKQRRLSSSDVHIHGPDGTRPSQSSSFVGRPTVLNDLIITSVKLADDNSGTCVATSLLSDLDPAAREFTSGEPMRLVVGIDDAAPFSAFLSELYRHTPE